MVAGRATEGAQSVQSQPQPSHQPPAIEPTTDLLPHQPNGGARCMKQESLAQRARAESERCQTPAPTKRPNEEESPAQWKRSRGEETPATISAVVSNLSDDEDSDDGFEIIEIKQEGATRDLTHAFKQERSQPSNRQAYQSAHDGAQRSSDYSVPLMQLELEEKRSRMQLMNEQRWIELDAAREEIKIELAVERALARQKLIQAGLSLEQVDCILPLDV